MSGDGRHRPENVGVVRAGSEADYTARRFPPEGLGLDGKGAQLPQDNGEGRPSGRH